MSATPGSVEQELSKGKFYFLSTARLPYGSYSYLDVTFVLDGVKLGQRYAGTALRYWRRQEGQLHQACCLLVLCPQDGALSTRRGGGCRRG